MSCFKQQIKRKTNAGVTSPGWYHHLLKIDWGLPQRTSGKGTFKEAWKLDWQPELSLAMIEAGR